MKRILLILIGFLALVQMRAAAVFTCDFESEQERQQWTLNPVVNAQLENKWYFNKAGNFSPTGEYGLFISSTGGDSAVYSANTAGWVIAHRSLTIPQGNYQICFNWRAMGKATGADRIYLCWVPDAANQPLNSGNGAAIPNWVNQYRLDTVRLTQALGWQYAKIPFTSDGQPGKLVYIWYNSATNAINPPACVDNIEILPKDITCAAPDNVYHTAIAGIVHLGWEGSADYYSLQSYDHRNGTWRVYENTADTALDISDLTEGVHSFYLRSHCGDEYSPWTPYTRFIVYEGTRCIDYMCLNNHNCYAGQILGQPGIQGQASYFVTNFTHKCIDYGYADKYSRHTIHYMDNEYDPRTDYKIKTVPDGELASVRLGNWDTGGESECIIYDLNVEAGASDILKIKYAVVMDSPIEMHPEKEQAHFTLNILDANGNVLDKDCSSADFAAGMGDQSGWVTTSGIIDNSFTLYRNWTEIAVSLRQYVGKHIKIQLTTADCTNGAHFCYAYFTLACESGELQGISCGESNTSFTAPDHFKYRWYREDQPNNILSTQQTFHIEPNDTMLYIVDVINKQPTLTGAECYFQLEALGLPRFPVAKATYTHSPANCQNYVVFNNQSYIRLHNALRQQEQDIVSTQKIEDYYWEFGDGTTSSSSDAYITHVYPIEGGHYRAVLHAYMSGGKCEDSISIDLDLPDISTQEYVQSKHICSGQSYQYKGAYYFEDFADTTVIRTEAGCDSVSIFQLFVHDQQLQHLDTFVCEQDFPIRFHDSGHDVIIEGPGKHVIRDTTRYAPDCQCESTIEWNVQTEPTLRVQAPDTLLICPDHGSLTLPYTILQGEMDSVCVVTGADAQASGFLSSYCFAAGDPIEIPLPDSINPGRHRVVLEFVTPRCPATQLNVLLEVGYPASIMAQKNYGWIGVLDKEAQQYGFQTYQWYRDGILLPDATNSYYPVTEEDRGHEFTVRVMRQGESYGLISCPVTYGKTTPLEDLVSPQDTLTRKYIYNGQLVIMHDGRLYNALGTLIQ